MFSVLKKYPNIDLGDDRFSIYQPEKEGLVLPLSLRLNLRAARRVSLSEGATPTG
jgi:hypothetical protein